MRAHGVMSTIGAALQIASAAVDSSEKKKTLAIC
jgi:hypothetical protein